MLGQLLTKVIGTQNERELKRLRPAVAEINARLFDEWGIIGGYDLSNDYAHLPQHMLLCVTEMNTRDEIDELVEALEEMTEDG